MLVTEVWADTIKISHTYTHIISLGDAHEAMERSEMNAIQLVPSISSGYDRSIIPSHMEQKSTLAAAFMTSIPG